MRRCTVSAEREAFDKGSSHRKAGEEHANTPTYSPVASTVGMNLFEVANRG
jgi:hypothetical protein